MTNEQLVIRIQAKENTAANMLTLWEQNKGIIYKIALKYQGYEEIEDLTQQGYIGLCNAVENYDIHSGIQFISYACYWIKSSIQRYIHKYSSIVRLPTHIREELYRYKKAIAHFEINFNRKPSDKEICALLEISANKLELIKKALVIGEMTSIDGLVKDSEDITIKDAIPSNENVENSVIDTLNQQEVKKVLWEMVDSLPKEDQEILKMRYQKGMTFREINTILGVSVEAVRQKEAKAIKELRKARRKKILACYVDGDIRDMAIKGTGAKNFNTTWTSSTERTALELLEKRKPLYSFAI